MRMPLFAAAVCFVGTPSRQQLGTPMVGARGRPGLPLLRKQTEAILSACRPEGDENYGGDGGGAGTFWLHRSALLRGSIQRIEFVHDPIIAGSLWFSASSRPRCQRHPSAVRSTGVN